MEMLRGPVSSAGLYSSLYFNLWMHQTLKFQQEASYSIAKRQETGRGK